MWKGEKQENLLHVEPRFGLAVLEANQIGDFEGNPVKGLKMGGRLNCALVIDFYENGPFRHFLEATPDLLLTFVIV